MSKDDVKMFASPLYIMIGCITVDKKSYNSETEAVPKGKVTEADAKRMIKSGVAAEVPAKTSIINLESAAKKKVKEQAGTIAEQHDELEKLKLELKDYPKAKEAAALVPDLKKEITKLEKAAEVSEKTIEKLKSDSAEATKTAVDAVMVEVEKDTKELTDQIAKLEKENGELREMAK